MKVPSEMVDAALRAGYRTPPREKYTPSRRDRADMRLALEAVLPMVREALLNENAAQGPWEIGKSCIEDGDWDEPFPRWRGMIRATFNAAFPEDES